MGFPYTPGSTNIVGWKMDKGKRCISQHTRMPPCYIMIYVMITLVLSPSFHANIIANMSYHVLHSAKICPSSSRIPHLKQMDGFQNLSQQPCHIPLSSQTYPGFNPASGDNPRSQIDMFETHIMVLQGNQNMHHEEGSRVIIFPMKGKFLQDCHSCVWFNPPWWCIYVHHP